MKPELPDPSERRPVRQRPVHLPLFDLTDQNPIVFVTVYTKGRREILSTPSIHDALREAWRQAGTWRVGRYIILPDHLHFFCGPAQWPPAALKPWVAFWKGLASRIIRKKIPDFHWQADYWDTQLKREDSYAAKWEYVRGNAVRHGLVSSAGDWPYQGELNLLHGNA